MAFGGFGRRKNGTTSFFVQAVLVILLIWLLFLGITLALTLRFSLNTMQEKTDNGLSSVAESLAASVAVRRAFREGVCSPELMEYLDCLVEKTEDLDIISMADASSRRIYHIVHQRIGGTFVGGDEQRVLAGEHYFSDAVGTMGYQHRYFSPVLEEDGSVLGFVMTSTTRDSLEALRWQIALSYGKLFLLLAAITILFTGIFALYLNEKLRGARPGDLLWISLVQNDILNSLEEGIVSLDRNGMIRFVNAAAVQTLGQHEELLLGRPVDELLRGKNEQSLCGVEGENLATSRPNLLTGSILTRSGGTLTGQVLILKDKSEAFRRAEQLSGSRNIISALRANNHEFMNKLQVISGLLQMGREEEAMNYIVSVSASQSQSIGPVIQLVHNSNVAALILGKMNNTRELDIHLTLLTNSFLPEHSRYLSTTELVTIVGNLLENAIEAVNAVPDQRTRRIVLQITEDGAGLLVEVSDTGIGIPPEQLERIFESGFSTKATEGRGYGMNLIRTIADRHGASLEVDSEPDTGTTITLICNQKRRDSGT